MHGKNIIKTVMAAAVAIIGLVGAQPDDSSAGTGGRRPVPELVEISAGSFIAGSDDAEREYAYQLDTRGYGHTITRQQAWYAGERARQKLELPAYDITRTAVTNRQYAAFIRAGDHPPPNVTPEEWQSYGLRHSYAETRRFAWNGATPPKGRKDHPVVLVSHRDAQAFARWLSEKTGQVWRLPTENEWEKAARGTEGRRFPWGDAFDPARLNSHDNGSFDTLGVGMFPAGASPFGVLDAAGQVFEWTADSRRAASHVVKGGSWDDKGCGICRPAARHNRPDGIKHILVGFRLVRERP